MDKKIFNPFDKVLVRDSEDDVWSVELFSHYDQDGSPVTSGLSSWEEVIPYEGNEKLLGTWDAVEHGFIGSYEPKDGDFIVSGWGIGECKWVAIYKEEKGVYDDYYSTYAGAYLTTPQKDSEVWLEEGCDAQEFTCPATEEEKQYLLSKLHEIGKDWDAEKKQIVDWKWELKIGDKFYTPNLDFGFTFVPYECNFEGFSTQKIREESGYVFHTEEECKSMCDKLNEAIKNVK